MEREEPVQASTFKGFRKHVEDTPLLQKLLEIVSGKHRKVVENIRTLVSTGETERAARTKRQLQACTVSATYNERRVPEAIRRYNDLLILDFDHLLPEVLEHCKRVMREDEFVLFAFLSPSGNGLKAGVRPATPQAEALRQAITTQQEVTYQQLEAYHKQLFELCKERYEALCGVEVDPSGSDIGRLCFWSYDPDAYINHAAMQELRGLPVRILPPNPPPAAAPARAPWKKLLQQELPGNPQADCTHINALIQMEFQKCASKVQRSMKYAPGQRDTFLYALGNNCYKKGIPQEAAAALAERSYGGAPGIDVATVIGNAYRYTSKTDHSEEERRKPVAVKLVDFLQKHYEVRRNEVLQRLEFRKRNNGEEIFLPMKRQDYNSVYIDTQFAGISCQPFMVKAVIDSRFAQSYHPFEEYFLGLPTWDGFDYIDQLAQTIETTSQEFWRDCFKRWLVGLVACALEEEKVNQMALILKGAQGKDKSTWIRQLLPPELRLYYRNGMLDPRNKDHMLFLSQRLLINLEEFEGMKNDNIAELKRLITQDAITERKAWDTEADFYIRRASFIASTNEPRFLEDTTGTRRFPTVTTEKIDFRTPVNHAGIYSQAVALWKSGFRYWFEEEEFQLLNMQNKHYHLPTAEEELLYVYFRKPRPEDLLVSWMSASAILSRLTIYGKTQMQNRNIRALVKILERDGFRKRITEQNIWEYEVIQIELIDVERGFKQ